MPGASMCVIARLASDALGAFEEAFHWQLRGTSAPVPLVIKGRVIGPTFELGAKEVDFGIVSYGFRWAPEPYVLAWSWGL